MKRRKSKIGLLIRGVVESLLEARRKVRRRMSGAWCGILEEPGAGSVSSRRGVVVLFAQVLGDQGKVCRFRNIPCGCFGAVHVNHSGCKPARHNASESSRIQGVWRLRQRPPHTRLYPVIEEPVRQANTAGGSDNSDY